MKYIRTYESFRNTEIDSSDELTNEEFLGLGKLIPDWLKNIRVKNSGKIDKALKEYKEGYEKSNKDLSSLLDSKDDIDEDRLKDIQSALLKKRNLLSKKLDNTLEKLTKDNEKSKNYANVKRNTIEIELIDSELESYQQMGLEESEYVKKLKENSDTAKEQKAESEKELKSAKKAKENSKTKIESEEDALVGDILLYTNNDEDKFIAKVTEEGKLIRISNVVDKKTFDDEKNKPEDEQKVMSLFNKVDDEFDPFSPNKWENLERISKKAQEKFS